jgi:hypothetical protein
MSRARERVKAEPSPIWQARVEADELRREAEATLKANPVP